MTHPSQWELCRASGPGQEGMVVFADRRYQRLDVRWRPVKYVPNTERMLERRRRCKNEEEVEVQRLCDAPAGWDGLVRETADGVVMHAARFFREMRWAVEVTIIWPDGRDVELERTILEEIDAPDPHAEMRLWQAMGMSVAIDGRYDLSSSSSRVGRVCWEFITNDRNVPTLSLERLAMVEYWLDGSLQDWLVDELPTGFSAVRYEAVNYNGHRGQQLISHAAAGIFSRLRGFRQVRLDLAWLCPAEGRVYHLGSHHCSRDEEISLPSLLEIGCCKRIPSTY